MIDWKSIHNIAEEILYNNDANDDDNADWVVRSNAVEVEVNDDDVCCVLLLATTTLSITVVVRTNE